MNCCKQCIAPIQDKAPLWCKEQNKCPCHTPAKSWEARLKQTLPIGFAGTDIELVIQQFFRKEIERVGKEQYLLSRLDILETILKKLPPEKEEGTPIGNQDEFSIGWNAHDIAVIKIINSLRTK